MILHNIKESDDTDSSKQREKDTSVTILILKDYLDVTVTVTKGFQIGKKWEDPNKPRLLKIMVNFLDEKDAILRNKSSL